MPIDCSIFCLSYFILSINNPSSFQIHYITRGSQVCFRNSKETDSIDQLLESAKLDTYMCVKLLLRLTKPLQDVFEDRDILPSDMTVVKN